MTSQDQPPSRETIAQQRAVIRYASIAALVVCPVLIALPPRKFDKFTVMAVASTGMGGNYLVGEYTGRSIVDRAKFSATGFLARSVEEKERVEEERRKIGGALGSEGEREGRGRRREEWKVQRDERERKALEEGKGYGDLIIDQIWDVWTWGKGSDK